MATGLCSRHGVEFGTLRVCHSAIAPLANSTRTALCWTPNEQICGQEIAESCALFRPKTALCCSFEQSSSEITPENWNRL